MWEVGNKLPGRDVSTSHLGGLKVFCKAVSITYTTKYRTKEGLQRKVLSRHSAPANTDRHGDLSLLVALSLSVRSPGSLASQVMSATVCHPGPWLLSTSGQTAKLSSKARSYPPRRFNAWMPMAFCTIAADGLEGVIGGACLRLHHHDLDSIFDLNLRFLRTSGDGGQRCVAPDRGG